MKTKDKSKMSSKDLLAKITMHIEELANETDEALFSQEMVAYLESCAKFHKYSAHNQWLIRFFMPSATKVAGFYRWKQLSRYVKKGEQGIPILAPCLYKEDDEDPNSSLQLRGIKTTYVFDISQTEGETLPPIPEWRSLEQNIHLQGKLIAFAEEKGISVKIKKLPGQIQGISRGGEIVLSPQAGTKTLIHEIAHELLHQGEGAQKGNKIILELEAEAVAYVVAKHYGLNNLACPRYIALHGASSEMIYEHFVKIKETSKKIICNLLIY